jgi:hypothetical protein
VTRDAIVAGARKALTRQVFHALGVRLMADQVGVRHVPSASSSRPVPSNDALIAGVLARVEAELPRQWTARPQDSVMALREEFTDAFTGWFAVPTILS